MQHGERACTQLRGCTWQDLSHNASSISLSQVLLLQYICIAVINGAHHHKAAGFLTLRAGSSCSLTLSNAGMLQYRELAACSYQWRPLLHRYSVRDAVHC